MHLAGLMNTFSQPKCIHTTTNWDIKHVREQNHLFPVVNRIKNT